MAWRSRETVDVIWRERSESTSESWKKIYRYQVEGRERYKNARNNLICLPHNLPSPEQFIWMVKTSVGVLIFGLILVVKIFKTYPTSLPDNFLFVCFWGWLVSEPTVNLSGLSHGWWISPQGFPFFMIEKLLLYFQLIGVHPLLSIYNIKGKTH